MNMGVLLCEKHQIKRHISIRMILMVFFSHFSRRSDTAADRIIKLRGARHLYVFIQC